MPVSKNNRKKGKRPNKNKTGAFGSPNIPEDNFPTYAELRRLKKTLMAEGKCPALLISSDIGYILNNKHKDDVKALLKELKITK